jgi:hypothetical protein
VNAKKMVLAVLVCMAAMVLAILATAHSRKILAQEQSVYPAGTLKLGEAGTVQGCSITLTDATVSEAVASADMTGSDLRAADPDWRFVRLQLSVENASSKAVNLKKLLGGLQVIETLSGKPARAEVVWLRGYDALPSGALPPGQLRQGKVAVYLSGYTLNFPSVLQIGEARWGVDVIDRNAPVQ